MKDLQYKKGQSHASSRSNNIHNQNNKYYLLPLIFIAAILPFIMRFHEYDPGLSGYNWFTDEKSWFDAFLYFKQVFLLIVCSVMILIILYKIYQDRRFLNFSKSLIPIFVYGLLALLSTLFSKYLSFGLSGIYEQFESVFAILGYCLIVYYAFLFINTEEDIRFIFKYLLIGILVFCMLGLSQAIGHDFIMTGLAKLLILPQKYWNELGLKFNFGANRVYLTLYNPNYVGVYVSLLAPILLALLLTEKHKLRKILYIIALIGLMISLIGSESKTSIISLSIALLFTLFFFRTYIFRKSKITIAIIGVCGIAVILIGALKFSAISNTINTMINVPKSSPALTDIRTEEMLSITYKDNILNVNADTSDNNITVILTDSEFNAVPYSVNDANSFTISDPRFAGIQITPKLYNDVICLAINIDGKDWIFSNQLGDNTFYYLNAKGKFDKIKTADHVLFNDYENFASGRGYIWSRTIPLLKKYVLLGSGADSFTLVFPQQDYVNLYNAGFDGQLITRPHNMYLQIGVQSGVISLIAFLAFYILYFISCIKLYWRGTFDNFFSQAGVAIFIGTIAYMIAGISNDSTITVAPVFWVLIGIGVTINFKLKKRSEN
ncbi:O-antigen ligase family protein [Anaerocolumna sp. MB42-C2]|uniref:O-antigen ligase family protein n=1 Tax=Anaerocolumna sp. MB42-C2 TaxID=3070997 RepID=UPI0027DF95FB|nr:O-antigen ligase family protein [Anaerocolumna sp. MB42-C2]WMJ89813.1 O-antigen ligase family protein [Anaerocolumna sp. MB42-C2]